MKRASSDWPEVCLGEVCEFKYGKGLPEASRTGGNVPVFGSNGVVGQHDTALTAGPTIVIGRKGSFGEVNYSPTPCWPIDTTYYVDSTTTKADVRWLLYRLSALGLNKLNRAAAVPGLNREDAYRKRLLLPPLPEQQRIAEILDKADVLRAKRRAALAQLDILTHSIFLDMFGDPATNLKGMRKEPLGNLIKLKSGDFLPATEMAESGAHAVLGGNGINGFHNRYMFEDRQIVIGRVGVYCGCVHVSPPKSWVTDNALYVSEHSDDLIFGYLVHALIHAQLNRYASQFGQPLVSGSRIYPVQVLVPPKNLQHLFVERLEKAANLKDSHESSRSALETLFASLQHRAFRGEL